MLLVFPPGFKSKTICISQVSGDIIFAKQTCLSLRIESHSHEISHRKCSAVHQADLCAFTSFAPKPSFIYNKNFSLSRASLPVTRCCHHFCEKSIKASQSKTQDIKRLGSFHHTESCFNCSYSKTFAPSGMKLRPALCAVHPGCTREDIC